VRVRRRVKVRREGFTAYHRAQLLTGRQFWSDVGYAAHPDLEAMARDWKDQRYELLTFWLQDPARWRLDNQVDSTNPVPGGPGTRPWAWWAFDSPRELRRVLVGDVPWLPIEDWPRETSFGKPTRFVRDPHDMRWEAEAIYLARHGLLSPAERWWL
jgi:hypothetical protein